MLPGEISASEVNTLLLVVGIPIISFIGKRVISTLGKLDRTVNILHTTLLGTESQGGLVRRVEGVAKQGHGHANDIMVLKSQMEDVIEERRVMVRRANDRKDKDG